MSIDGWKFAEQLVGITDEALRRAREGVKFPTWAIMQQHEAAGMCPGCDGRNGEHWTECGVLHARWSGEKRVEDRLWAVLPAGQRKANVGLKDALREVTEAVADAQKWREREKTAPSIRDAERQDAEDCLLQRLNEALGERHLHVINAIEHVRNLAHWTRETERKVRDAALEEAEYALRKWDADAEDSRVIFEVIRALKSKPAPDLRPRQSDCCMECEKPKDAHGMSCSQAAVATFEALQQEGMRRGGEKWERGEMDGPTPDPVHDFGWALAQMRAGKKVRRESWFPGAIIDIKSKGYTGHMECLLATDWEVVE